MQVCQAKTVTAPKTFLFTFCDFFFPPPQAIFCRNNSSIMPRFAFLMSKVLEFTAERHETPQKDPSAKFGKISSFEVLESVLLAWTSFRDAYGNGIEQNKLQ